MHDSGDYLIAGSVLRRFLKKADTSDKGPYNHRYYSKAVASYNYTVIISIIRYYCVNFYCEGYFFVSTVLDMLKSKKKDNKMFMIVKKLNGNA